MSIAIAPLVVCLAGLLMWILATSTPKVAEIGKIMFAAGLLVTLFFVGAKTIKIG